MKVIYPLHFRHAPAVALFSLKFEIYSRILDGRVQPVSLRSYTTVIDRTTCAIHQLIGCVYWLVPSASLRAKVSYCI